MYLIKYYYNLGADANLAQPVEQRIRNAWVACSSHAVGTSFYKNAENPDERFSAFFSAGKIGVFAVFYKGNKNDKKFLCFSPR